VPSIGNSRKLCTRRFHNVLQIKNTTLETIAFFITLKYVYNFTTLEAIKIVSLAFLHELIVFNYVAENTNHEQYYTWYYHLHVKIPMLKNHISSVTHLKTDNIFSHGEHQKMIMKFLMSPYTLKFSIVPKES
jgi:hypothetical protein